jgi:hypothetical protein
MTSKNPVRSCEDVDESVLSYAEIKALAAGNPKIKEKMELDVQVAKLRVAKTSHQNAQYTLQDKLRRELPARMSFLENRLSVLRKDIELRNANSPEPDEKSAGKSPNEEKENFSMTINGKVYDKRDKAGKELITLSEAYNSVEPIKIGDYRGFDMTLEFNPYFNMHHIILNGNDKYWVKLGDSGAGNITKLNNILNELDDQITQTEEELKACVNQIKLAQEQLEKPFAQEDELAEKSARLAKINLELNIDNHSRMDDEDELTLSEDEEYDYRNELEERGIDEADLFSRENDDPYEVVGGVGEELTEQGKNDALRAEIESGAMLDIDGTLVKESSGDFDESANITAIDSHTDAPAEEAMTSAELYGGKMNLENYSDYRYPKAAQFLDLHGVNITSLEKADDVTYSLLIEGTVNSVLQDEHLAEPSLKPRASNDEYHFTRDCAMSVVCRELDMPDFPPPPASKNFSGEDIWQMRERGYKTADIALYGHLPKAERDTILKSGSNSADEAEKESGAKITSLSDYAEERKAIIAEAKRKLAEDGAVPVITDAIEGRAYAGEIVEIGSAYAVQKIDEGRGIIHNLSYLKDFSRVINQSGVPYLEITYDREMNGSIGAKEAEQGRTASMAR